MKTEELNALKNEVENMNMKLSALTDEDLMQVSGGYSPSSVIPSTPSMPSASTENFTVPIKGENCQG